MTNDETQMTKLASRGPLRHLSFGFRHGLVILVSSFVMVGYAGVTSTFFPTLSRSLSTSTDANTRQVAPFLISTTGSLVG